MSSSSEPSRATDSGAIRSGLWLPLFDALADPWVCAGLAAEAETGGWDGVFVWDHLNWSAPVRGVGDPWITLSAISVATESVLVGPMVTPLARRRPVKVARETVTLDRLARGRLVLGVGLGHDRFGNEFSATGEAVDARQRASMLDESLAVLAAAWSGRTVEYRGAHYTVDGMRFEPSPFAGGPIPVWVGGGAGRRLPLERAARHAGYVPVNLEGPDQLAESIATIDGLRGHPLPGEYDVAVGLPLGVDPRPYADAGATWWLTEFDPCSVTPDAVRGVIRDGPAR